MSTGIFLMREIFHDGKWYNLEIEENENKRSFADIDQNYKLFTLLADVRGFTVFESLHDLHNKYPTNMSNETYERFKHLTYAEERKRFNDDNNSLYDCYTCTLRDIDEFIGKWRVNIFKTGFIPREQITDEGDMLLSMYINGFYNKSKCGNTHDEISTFLLYIYETYGLMKEFYHTLLNLPINVPECMRVEGKDYTDASISSFADWDESKIRIVYTFE